MNRYVNLDQTFMGLISRYMDSSGNIDYFSLSNDDSLFKYAESLEHSDLNKLETKEQKLAFWINAYNTLSIYGVVKKLKKDPSFAEEGNRSFFQRVKFFAIQKFRIGGKKWTLYSLEKFIRKEFREPRIHFALNCSSGGCPLLKDGLYSAENLNAELDMATQLFINSPRGVVLDEDKKTILLSMIFKWYKDDFEASGKSLLQYVAHFLPDNKREFILKNEKNLKVEYMDYDWSLNIKKPLPSQSLYSINNG